MALYQQTRTYSVSVRSYYCIYRNSRNCIALLMARWKRTLFRVDPTKAHSYQKLVDYKRHKRAKGLRQAQRMHQKKLPNGLKGINVVTEESPTNVPEPGGLPQ